MQLTYARKKNIAVSRYNLQNGNILWGNLWYLGDLYNW